MSAGLFGLIAAMVLGVVVVWLYNRLITLKNRYLNGFSQIEVQLQRRYELIPNLVDTASAYMKHEQKTLMAVTQARNRAAEQCDKTARNPQDKQNLSALARADSALTSALGQLNFVMENYPDLKADAQMRDLHEELTSTDNRVAYARQAYSDAVMDYNISREQFPAVMVARAFAFKEAQLFEAEDPAMRKAVKVSFA